MNSKKIPVEFETALIAHGYKPKLAVNVLFDIEKEPGYVYKGVISNYRHLPQNIDNHLKAGFEFVYGTSKVKDDRNFSPNSEARENTVPGPVIGTTQEGLNYVVMRIKKDKLDAYMVEKAKEYQESYRRSVGKHNIKHVGPDQIHVKGSEFNVSDNNSRGETL